MRSNGKKENREVILAIVIIILFVLATGYCINGCFNEINKIKKP